MAQRKQIKDSNTFANSEVECSSTEDYQDQSCSDSRSKSKLHHRQDILLWILGIVFILLVAWITFITGDLRQWEALSGFEHNRTITSKERFESEPYEQENVKGRYGPDAAGRWYYWKIKSRDVTVMTRLFPWLGYISHQCIIWAVIYTAQLQKLRSGKEGSDRFQTNVTVLNWFSLFVNALFTILHFINTHTTYDALAQDVSIASSQSSVVVILIFILIMDYKERGLLFGWPSPRDLSCITRSLTLNYEPSNLIRRYHGYAFSWAAVFTFWYHPMENTLGHVTGVVYCWLILLQGSLLYTRLHINVYWRQLLEAWVIVHAAIVAAQTGGPAMNGTRLWPMFTFGFLFIWVVSQVHGLPVFLDAKKRVKYLPLAIFLAFVTWAYSWIPNKDGRMWIRMPEILRLPAIIYLYFIFGWSSMMLLLKLQRTLTQADVKEYRPNKHRLLIVFAAAIYGLEIAFAVLAQYYDIQMRLSKLSFLFDGVFVVSCAASFVLLDEAMKGVASKGKVT